MIYTVHGMNSSRRTGVSCAKCFFPFKQAALRKKRERRIRVAGNFGSPACGERNLRAADERAFLDRGSTSHEV